MKNKTLIVVFDKHCNRILTSSRINNSRGTSGHKEDRIEAALSEVGTQFKNVNLIHIMDVTTCFDESISLYVARLNGYVDPTNVHNYLFWVPVQHLGICSGFLSGTATGFERMIKDYAISLVVDGCVKFPQ